MTFYPLIIEYIGANARNLTNVIAQCGLVGNHGNQNQFAEHLSIY